MILVGGSKSDDTNECQSIYKKKNIEKIGYILLRAI